jgi:hypothetical protein
MQARFALVAGTTISGRHAHVWFGARPKGLRTASALGAEIEPRGGSRDRPNAHSLPLTHGPNELSDECPAPLIDGASANRHSAKPPPESVS